MLKSMQTNLKFSGFNVEIASDGFQALDKLKAGLKPDLIITDINMPRMNGLEFIKSARSLPGLRFVPILTLTTESQQGMRDEAKRLGATGWLVKPVAIADLIRTIKQVVPGA